MGRVSPGDSRRFWTDWAIWEEYGKRQGYKFLICLGDGYSDIALYWTGKHCVRVRHFELEWERLCNKLSEALDTRTQQAINTIKSSI